MLDFYITLNKQWEVKFQSQHFFQVYPETEVTSVIRGFHAFRDGNTIKLVRRKNEKVVIFRLKAEAGYVPFVEYSSKYEVVIDCYVVDGGSSVKLLVINQPIMQPVDIKFYIARIRGYNNVDFFDFRVKGCTLLHMNAEVDNLLDYLVGVNHV